MVLAFFWAAKKMSRAPMTPREPKPPHIAATKEPSGAEALHRYLYLAHPEVGAIILAQPPNLTAFCVSHTKLDTRLMPESFVFPGDVPPLPFGSQYRDPRAVAGSISRKQPVALIENECVLAAGNDLLAAFDRLEVAELSAGSVLGAQAIGGVINMTAKARQEITDTYVKD